jgi:glycosyltransferase involved in cell wall biosynthesis
MKVGYDSGTTRNAQGTGTYASRLLEALSGKVEAVGFDYEDFRKTMGFGVKMRKHFQRVVSGTSGDVYWEWNVVPRLGAEAKIDIYHALGTCVPLSAPFKRVMTIHDLAFYYDDAYLTPPARKWFTKLYRQSAESADALIAISESTKRDILKHWNVAPEKVHVVHHAVGKEFFERMPQERIDSALKKHRIPGKYYLFVGELNHRKNLHTLAEAFSKCEKDTYLVLCGAPQEGGYAAGLEETIQRLGVRERVVLTGRVGFDELRCLYQGALAFVFPSLCEGFGLPILEAQASQTPVVCADNSSMPEVAGDGALLVPAKDVEKIAEAMREIDAIRDKIITNGSENVRRFNWDTTAGKTVRVYSDLIYV